MLVTKPAYFDRFACLAGDCPDTCCGAWQVIIDEKSLALYRSVGGGLGEKIRGALLAEAGETRFAMERGRCRLLTPEGLCTIQKGGGAPDPDGAGTLFPELRADRRTHHRDP